MLSDPTYLGYIYSYPSKAYALLWGDVNIGSQVSPRDTSKTNGAKPKNTSPTVHWCSLGSVTHAPCTKAYDSTNIMPPQKNITRSQAL